MRVLSVLVSGILLFSCAVKKEKVSQFKTCEDMFNYVVENQKKQSSGFKVYSYVSFEGKTLLMKGKFNKYGGGTIKFYLPIGKKVATLKKEGEEFCIEKEGRCKRVENPFRRIGISIEKLITRKFNVSSYDKYSCIDNRLLVNKPGFSLVYEDGKLKNVLIRNLLINYKSDKEIYIYDTGKLLAKFRISKILYER